jgi:hypothetical protein
MGVMVLMVQLPSHCSYVDAREWLRTDGHFGQAAVDWERTKWNVQALWKTWSGKVSVHTGFIGESTIQFTPLVVNHSIHTPLVVNQPIHSSSVVNHANQCSSVVNHLIHTVLNIVCVVHCALLVHFYCHSTMCPRVIVNHSSDGEPSVRW